MTAVSLAPLTLTLLGALTPRPSSQLADLTIRTRSTYGPRGAPVETLTVQLKGSRQRMVSRTDIPRGHTSASYTTILQCDRDRVITINDLAKVYAIEPIRHHLPPAAAFMRAPFVEDSRPVVETRTIDAADTGERRTYGPLVARHVITTTTVERVGVGAAIVASVRDGWYVDLPPADCGRSARMTATLAVLSAGRSDGRVDVKWKGRATTGFPVEERDRMMDGMTLQRKVELVEVSDASLPDRVFDVPAGYRPALPLPFTGGYDLTRADTMLNRASVLWSTAGLWVRQLWP